MLVNKLEIYYLFHYTLSLLFIDVKINFAKLFNKFKVKDCFQLRQHFDRLITFIKSVIAMQNINHHFNIKFTL